MPRPPRVDFTGAWHHVMNRGARREEIFLSEAHYLLFLDQLAVAVEETDIEVHAYALMPNHFHLLVRSPRATLSRAMKRLCAGFTQRLNWELDWDGPVFRGRFHSKLVSDEQHLLELLAYLHLNPVRAGLVSHPKDWTWSSHRALIDVDEVPGWLTTWGMRQLLGQPADVERFVLDRIEAAAPLEEPPRGSEDSAWERFRSLRAPRSPWTTSAVLLAVLDVTDVPATSLSRTIHGPRGNAPRRLAAWALVEFARLTHREVADVLGFTPPQASATLRRVRTKPKQPRFLQWQAELHKRLERVTD